MHAVAGFDRHEDLRIELQTAARIGIALDHPSLDALGIELSIPRAIQTVGEVHTPPIAAHLNHLRSAIYRARSRVRRAIDDAAEPDGAGEARILRNRYVVLATLARAPARDIEEAVI